MGRKPKIEWKLTCFVRCGFAVEKHHIHGLHVRRLFGSHVEEGAAPEGVVRQTLSQWQLVVAMVTEHMGGAVDADADADGNGRQEKGDNRLKQL